MAKRPSHAKLAMRVVPPEVCAARMTKFLSSRPRHSKTAEYVATLPKRKKVIVKPEEFERAKQIAKAVVEKAAEMTKHEAVTLVAVPDRKARLRPRARMNITKQVSMWACRPTALRHIDGQSAQKGPRDMGECERQRKLLYDAQEGLCGLCAKPMEPYFKWSLDHVIPRFLGGQDRLGNLLLCHGECNGRKSNDAPTGCECVTLLAINAKIGVQPQYWKVPPEITRLTNDGRS